jgi:hypothetical protein
MKIKHTSTIKQIEQWVLAMDDRRLLTYWHEYCAPTETASNPSETDNLIACIVDYEINTRGL